MERNIIVHGHQLKKSELTKHPNKMRYERKSVPDRTLFLNGDSMSLDVV